MDSGMNSIESMYLNYSGLLEEFSEDVIRSRYAFLYKECMEFLKSQKLESEVRLDEVLLMHAVLDYFSDVSRLKKFHHIHHINETKVIAYETFWLLRRKPLQVVTQRQDDFLAFINEKFVFSRLAAFLVGNRKDQVLREQDKKAFMNYLDTLYYFLKYRQYDPKMLELSVYEGIPHLLTEVVTDMKDAANALRWCVNEMERRYKLMSALGVRNLAGYNEKIAEADRMMRPIPDPYWKPGDSMDAQHPVLKKEPYIVVLVDEFADLMMTVGKKVEELIARLAQKARAAGIHLVLATQRPSVDVITGLIKANIPTRIAFTVSSKIDSRTILDQAGAESLLGMGDMLYSGPNSTLPVRVHGAFVRDQEVHAVVQDWKARGRPQYVDGITSDSESEGGAGGFDGAEELDPLFDQAVQFVTEKRKASISGVQRQFRIGYNRAARIIEQMEAQGIVSEQGHNGNREVLAPPPFD